MDTQWCDVSEFQVVVNNRYPYKVFAFRANDGTYRDRHFLQNLAWAKSAANSGRIDLFIVYAVYEPGRKWVDTLMALVGTPHRQMVVMIDVESWSGRIRGDHSRDINAGRARLAKWLGSDKRVIGYGNGYDLRDIWRSRGNARIVLAAYGSNPGFPNKIAHQYTQSGTVAPFGHPVDVNSADGSSTADLMRVFGISKAPKPVVKPAPASVGKAYPVFPLKQGYYFGPRKPIWNLKSVSGYFSHSADLKRWQEQARAKGFYHGVIDGKYGPLTASAALAVQTKNKLTRDKLIGPNTWKYVWTGPHA